MSPFDISRTIRQSHVALDRQCVVRRRDFLKTCSVASLAAGMLGWRDLVSLHAEDLRKRQKACILLWMRGGPSQFETFSPKTGHENAGETKSIATNVSGIEFAETYPKLAQMADRLAIVRSMTSKEGNHQRASYFLHTGYLPTGSVKYPTFGSIVTSQLHGEDCQLPAFVRIGDRGRDSGSGGFLGVEHDPFILNDADAAPPNTQITTSAERFERRLGLVGQLDEAYAAQGLAQTVADHRKLYDKASRMILSSQMRAFDIEQEPATTRDAYGRTRFGNGCLLARRLVESGVTFVEVDLGGWDTHDDGFNRTTTLAGQVDQPFAHLLTDLEQRGMLDSTLVVWMGEFGRTPKINPKGGRDHYPRAFNVALAGGGVKGGQVIGATDDAGVQVTDRPVHVNDLFQSFCRSLAINPAFENMSSIGRPIKLVDGGQPVDELFG